MIKDIAVTIPRNNEYYNFLCPNCNSKNIRVIPIGISYTTTIVNNNDIANTQFKIGYTKMPHISEVLENPDVIKICECNSCKIKSRITKVINIQDLKKYLRKNNIEKPMVIQ